MDWFKGKSTGNPWVFTIKYRNIGLSCKFSHHPILWNMYPLVIQHSHGIDGLFIDGLPNFKMVIFSMAMLVITRWYIPLKSH